MGSSTVGRAVVCCQFTVIGFGMCYRLQVLSLVSVLYNEDSPVEQSPHSRPSHLAKEWYDIVVFSRIFGGVCWVTYL